LIECEKAAYVSCFELAVGYVAVEILADAINFSAGIRACKKLDIKSFSRIVKALSTIRHTGIIGVRAPQALLDTQRWMLPMQSFYEGHEQCDLGLGIICMNGTWGESAAGWSCGESAAAPRMQGGGESAAALAYALRTY
jgi:hypothetical protein